MSKEKVIQAVIASAKAQIGYREKASNAQLDSPTANAGSNNYTKYAQYFDDLRAKGILFYNGRKNGPAGEWCDMFVDWNVCQVCGPELGMKVLYQPTESCGAGVKFSADYYRANGAFFTKNPQPGDQIMFGPRNHENHTGLVVAVDKDKVYTIEGNTSNACLEKSYYLSDSNISGYGRPRYELAAHLFEDDQPEQPAPDAPILDDQGSVCTVELPVLHYGSSGLYVETLQELLNHYAGEKLGLDASFGRLTEAAVNRYKTRHGLDPDGKMDAKTWELLLR